jgi:hypothetical protein
MLDSFDLPSDPVQFFAWLKSASEEYWADAFVHPGVYGFQIQAGTRWLPGLTDDEITRYEMDMGFAFPDIYKQFLRQMNGTDKLGVNVYGSSGVSHAYAPIYYSYPRDLATVREYIRWIYDAYGVTPEIVEERCIPHIMPIRGHRFLVMDRNQEHSVLSMHGNDTILYAESLSVFLVLDIFESGAVVIDTEDSTVKFWLEGSEATS